MKRNGRYRARRFCRRTTNSAKERGDHSRRSMRVIYAICEDERNEMVIRRLLARGYSMTTRALRSRKRRGAGRMKRVLARTNAPLAQERFADGRAVSLGGWSARRRG
jgi:hypothetical protein